MNSLKESWQDEIAKASRQARLPDFAGDHVEMDPQRCLWSVVVDVSEGCNLSCPMCSRPETTGEQADEEFVRNLAEKLLPRAQHVSIGCLSEPLLHPGLAATLAALDRARQGGRLAAHLCLLTSGTLLNDRRAEEIGTSGLDTLLVSVDTTHPETYAKVRRPAKWSTTRENLKNFMAGNNRFGLNVVNQALIMKSVLPHIPDTVDLLSQLGISRFNFTQLTQAPQAARDEVIRSSDPVFGEVQALCSRLESLEVAVSCPQPDTTPDGEVAPLYGDGRVWDEDLLQERRPALCMAPWYNLRVDHRGDVFPCNLMKLPENSWGNLHEESFEGIVNHPRATALRRELLRGSVSNRECARCPYGPRR